MNVGGIDGRLTANSAIRTYGAHRWFFKIIGFQGAFVPGILLLMRTGYFDIRLPSYVSQFTAESSDARTLMRATWRFVSMNHAALSGQ